MNIKRFMLAALAVLLLGSGAAIAAGGNELMYQKIGQLTTLAPASIDAAADYIPVYDASANVVKKLLAGAAGQSNYETVTTTNVLTLDECGKTFGLSLAGGFTTTFPAPSAGCKFKFFVRVSPTTAYILASNAGADVIHVHVNELETDTADDGPYDDNADTVNFVANVAVTGDFLECVSDGTGWYCNGQTNADGGVTSSTT